MRSRIMILLLAAALIAPAFAQSESSEGAVQRTALSFVEYTEYEKGDGIFAITLGMSAPVAYYDPVAEKATWFQSWPGFAFSLSYMGFLDEHWAIGGDLAGSFINTLAERRLFVAPLSFRAAYMINLSPFAIFPSAGLGIAISSLGDYRHIDPLVKLGSSFYYRVNDDMSYGLNLFTNIIPQFYKDSSQNSFGVFQELTLSLAYHL